ncbi:MAG: Fumarase alpha subunit [Methanoculleus marisnigri]|jgi:hydro-lyases, Fe-S type, tartrate/fumarate subfamily, alpha region|uniref:Fumarase alpha subunit n=1 Tax=Methanoculleus marisnigri TaxID=2198 RepID=A0A124G5X2_9EURY|nr:fumarate hydratase [Methanoculleus marisnigri]KUL04561.1 MAG: Fumarase alpha subunit [Methanoculleus marisnigri]
MMVNPADTTLSGALADATERALAEAEIRLPPDVLAVLRRAAAAERDEIARQELGHILENIALAGERQVPICQDTGVPVIYLTLPPDIGLSPDLFSGVREGVRRATATIPLRPNVVDPLTRENTNDNTGVGMPAVHVTPGDRLTVTVLPKGAGSENVSRIGMLLPSQAAQIPRFVAETMLLAGGKPCPPVILGVGIGGTFDMAAALAKEALLLPVDTMDDYEQEICDAVNALGIGPMGLGGDTTALSVKVKRADCHTASLPVAVNVQCWACRRATVEVKR